MECARTLDPRQDVTCTPWRSCTARRGASKVFVHTKYHHLDSIMDLMHTTSASPCLALEPHRCRSLLILDRHRVDTVPLVGRRQPLTREYVS